MSGTRRKMSGMHSMMADGEINWKIYGIGAKMSAIVKKMLGIAAKMFVTARKIA
jgi:hypothetical protein